MRARFCLLCGAGLATVRNGAGRRRRCPRCGWTFYDNPVPAVVALIVSRGRVLLTRRAHAPYAGTWDVPGGFMEADEAPDAALRRELREELGLRVSRARLIGFTTDRYGPRGFPVLTLLYRVIPVGTRFTAADDVAEGRWFPEGRVPFREIAFPGLRRLLRRCLRAGR